MFRKKEFWFGLIAGLIIGSVGLLFFLGWIAKVS